jgi:SRSO17 transposase
MERRFQVRRDELMAECEVAPVVFEGITERLELFLRPFLQTLRSAEQRAHAQTYMDGLLSDLPRKNTESIAYRRDQDRMGLQRFIGWAPWDDAPLRQELVRQVGRELGEADGVIVFDPSAFPKKGKCSVGVQRQWCGRLGKVENCQVGVFMGYVSRKEHALVDVRLYLPKDWAHDQARREKAGVPEDVRYRTRHALCLEMLAANGASLPHAWIAGDDELGRPYHFRRDLQRLNERYLLAIPSNLLIRDLDAAAPAYQGKGQPRKRPWQRVDTWCRTLLPEAWTQLEVRDGEKGPLCVEIVKRRVAGRTDQHSEAPPETLVIIRRTDEDGNPIHDYYLSNADFETPLTEFARVAKAEHRIEECLQRGKTEAGQADYEVRTWNGWLRHQTLALMAVWFLVCETREGKKNRPGDDRPASPQSDRARPAHSLPLRHPRVARTPRDASPATKPTRQTLSLETPQTFAAVER